MLTVITINLTQTQKFKKDKLSLNMILTLMASILSTCLLVSFSAFDNFLFGIGLLEEDFLLVPGTLQLKHVIFMKWGWSPNLLWERIFPSSSLIPVNHSHWMLSDALCLYCQSVASSTIQGQQCLTSKEPFAAMRGQYYHLFMTTAETSILFTALNALFI